ncbi:MAG: low molecular weight protein arginine phosphatase [Gemmatimonadaceae bacterium]
MRILFVCTGNTCRSAMAEAIARGMAEERQMPEIQVLSAGTSAWDSAPASDGAMLVALEHAADVMSHRARLLTADMVHAADLVLVMGPHHLERARALGAGSKAHLLTDYASRGASVRAVNDPFGGDLEVYRDTYEELEREIRRAFDRIAAERAPERS